MLNDNIHLIESEQNNLSNEQKELLRILLLSKNYFLPYTLDGNWDFADSIKVADNVELVKALLISDEWYFDVSGCSLDDVVYMLEIYLNNNELKNKVLAPYRKHKGHYLKKNIKSKIELYLSYDDILAIYRKELCKSKLWNNLIHEEDINKEFKYDVNTINKIKFEDLEKYTDGKLSEVHKNIYDCIKRIQAMKFDGANPVQHQNKLVLDAKIDLGMVEAVLELRKLPIPTYGFKWGIKQHSKMKEDSELNLKALIISFIIAICVVCGMFSWNIMGTILILATLALVIWSIHDNKNVIINYIKNMFR